MMRPSNVTARPAFMRSWRTAVHRGFRSTRRIAFTAKLATSRTRPRTSTGSSPKVVEAPITRTCDSLAAVLALCLAASAQASSTAAPLTTYVAARAAEMNGDDARSAQLFAAMAAADPADRTIARRAIATAIQSGQAELAISLAKKIPGDQLPID